MAEYVTKKYVAIIASMDEVESVEELKDMLREGQRPENSSVFRFELETDTPELASLAGRGYFFENGWCMDDTVSWIGPESEVPNA